MWSELRFKHVVFVWVFLAFTQLANASEPGPYVGGQLGWGYLHQGEFVSTQINKALNKNFPGVTIKPFHIFMNDTGLGQRIFVGYQANRYFAAEFGYYHFTNLDVNLNVNTNVALSLAKLNFKYDFPVNFYSHVNVKTQAFDLVGKVILPVTENFSVYGKLGLAYLDSYGKANMLVSTPIGTVSASVNPAVSLMAPTYGIGLNYDLSKHLSVDGAWSRIQQVSPSFFPNIDFVGVGIIYHF